jgi:hypothetical protein
LPHQNPLELELELMLVMMQFESKIEPQTSGGIKRHDVQMMAGREASVQQVSVVVVKVQVVVATRFSSGFLALVKVGISILEVVPVEFSRS